MKNKLSFKFKNTRPLITKNKLVFKFKYESPLKIKNKNEDRKENVIYLIVFIF